MEVQILMPRCIWWGICAAQYVYIFDKTPLSDYIEQPPREPDLVIEVPAHLHNNAGVLVRDHLINNVFT